MPLLWPRYYYLLAPILPVVTVTVVHIMIRTNYHLILCLALCLWGKKNRNLNIIFFRVTTGRKRAPIRERVDPLNLDDKRFSDNFSESEENESEKDER